MRFLFVSYQHPQKTILKKTVRECDSLNGLLTDRPRKLGSRLDGFRLEVAGDIGQKESQALRFNALVWLEDERGWARFVAWYSGRFTRGDAWQTPGGALKGLPGIDDFSSRK